MTSKKWVASVLVVLVGSPFAVAALDAMGVGPNWQVDVPTWQAGHTWTYQSTMDLEFDFSSSWGDEAGALHMLAESRRTVVNTTAEHRGVGVYALVDQYTPKRVIEDGQVVYQAERNQTPQEPESHGAVDEGFVSVPHEFCMIECGASDAYVTRADLNPVFEGSDFEDDEFRLLQFPLKHGATWSVYRQSYDWGMGQKVVEEIEARVAGRDIVNLPGVGSMEAVRIEAVITEESLRSMRASMGAGAAMGMSLDMDIEYRFTYWYAPEAKNIVRMDMVKVEDISMAFEGERMDFRMVIESRDVLSDYSLKVIPERSLEETGKLRSLLGDLPGVTELSDVDWPFTLRADRLSADVTKGDTVTLGIQEGLHDQESGTMDFTELPDGMSLKWRHRYMEVEQAGLPTIGKEDWYTGETLEISPRSGVHQVVAYLLDDQDRLVDLDSIMIEGYSTCGAYSTLPAGLPAGTGGPLRCVFTSNVFLDHIKLEVDTNMVAFGEAFVEDRMESRYWYTFHGGGQDTYYYTETGYLDIPKEYHAGYRDTARAGDAAVSVALHYDRGVDDETFESRWADDGGYGVMVFTETSGGYMECSSSVFAVCLLEDLAMGAQPSLDPRPFVAGLLRR
jgi:hypothetical protein